MKNILSTVFIVLSMLAVVCCWEDEVKQNESENTGQGEVIQNLFRIPKESLNGWNEGFIQCLGDSKSGMCCVQKADSITGDVRVLVSSTDGSAQDDSFVAIFGGDGTFQMAMFNGINYLVEDVGGKLNMIGYDKDWNKVHESVFDEALVPNNRRALASSRATSLFDVYSSLADVWKYGTQVFNWKNNSDRINTFMNVIKDVGVGKLVSLAKFGGGPLSFIASVAIDQLIDDFFNLYKSSMYGRYINVVITNVDMRNRKFTVEITGELKSGHTYQLAVAGRYARLMSDNKVDYTHAEYRTETITINNNRQSYTLSLNENLKEVGKYFFVPYLLVDSHAQDKYITMRGWYAYYGPSYTYYYPNPIVQSIKQNKCEQRSSNPTYVDFDVDFQIDMDSYANVKDVKVVLYNKRSQIAYGSSGTPTSNAVSVKVEGSIEKSQFDKNGELLLDYAIIPRGSLIVEDTGFEIVEKAVRLKLTNTTCPDSHHPHAIDLGLPSGTKWACCNVDASTPEGYGGYYAWGETSEKSVYNEETYQYCTGVDTNGDGWYEYYNISYQNIGSDIAGTSYDVAHVRMGGSWRMPSSAQQQELMNYCTRTWTHQNGVYGILVKGKNGGQLFLPAAGNRRGDSLHNEGSYGDYRSSSLGQYYDSDTYALYFDSGGWELQGISTRYAGRSVRAVCP